MSEHLHGHMPVELGPVGTVGVAGSSCSQTAEYGSASAPLLTPRTLLGLYHNTFDPPRPRPVPGTARRCDAESSALPCRACLLHLDTHTSLMCHSYVTQGLEEQCQQASLALSRRIRSCAPYF
eukprot:350729-Chlamydomonas_euryale.AAC.1